LKKIALVILFASLFLFWKRPRTTAPVTTEAEPTQSVTAPVHVVPGTSAPRPPPLVTRPELQRAVVLGEKVLHSKKELQEYRRLLASTQLIQEGYQRLREIAPGEEVEEARMQTIDFLNAALNWKQNPERERILKAIVTVLEQPISELEAPLDVKRSKAGDAMELYSILFTHDPTRARDIFDRADEEQRRLYRFATQMANQKKKIREEN